MKSINILLPFIALALVIIMLGSMILSNNEAPAQPIISTKTAQLSFIPPGFPRNVTDDSEGWIPEFDARFAKLDPITVFKIPKATIFSSPIGTETGAFTYNAQKFWTENPHRGGRHTGDDLNGIGGQNSDLGDPVYAIADGYIIYAGTPSPGWGKVILVAHRIERDGKEEILQSMYAHLQRSQVAVDSYVKRGQKIGTVGNADGNYLAHLHFELRKGTHLYIGPGYLQEPRNHLSPEEFLSTYLSDQLVFTKLEKQQDSDQAPWQELEIINPELMLELK